MGAVLCLSSGSVVHFKGDAVVNAANQRCLSGGGVDGAITKCGGPILAAARRELPLVDGSDFIRCPTGEARMTIGGSLPSTYCIHAVGPDYIEETTRNGKTYEDCDGLLFNAYQASMICARERRSRTVAFSLLSAGVFKGYRNLKTVLET